MKLKNLLAMLCILFLSNDAIAEHSSLKPFTAEYELRLGNIKVAGLERKLSVVSNDEYLIETHASTQGLARLFKKDNTHETSRFSFINGSIIPINYSYSRERKNKSKKTHIHFNHVSNTFASSINENHYSINFVPPLYDKLCYQIDMMLKLSSGKELSTQNITDGKKISKYTYNKLENDTVKIKQKTLKTEKWRRQKSNSPDKTIFWLAQELNYLPVKLEIHEEGEETIEIIMTSTSLMNEL